MQCPNCHNQVPDAANVCGHCGYRLKVLAPPAPPPDLQQAPAPSPKMEFPGYVWGIIGGLVVSLLVGALLFIFGVPLPSFRLQATPTDVSAPPQPQLTAAPLQPRPAAIITESPDSESQPQPPRVPPEAPQAEPPYALPDQVSEFLPGAKVVFTDDFNELSTEAWIYPEEPARISNGQLEITGKSPFAAQFWRVPTLSEGSAVLLLMNFNQSAAFVSGVQRGEWQTANFRQFAFNDSWTSYIIEGANESQVQGDFSGTALPVPGRWYYLLEALGKNAEFRAVVWERDNPSQRAEFHGQPLTGWSGLEWTFFMGVDSGLVMLDEYAERSFTSFQ